jgi:hypothetical protein
VQLDANSKTQTKPIDTKVAGSTPAATSNQLQNPNSSPWTTTTAKGVWDGTKWVSGKLDGIQETTVAKMGAAAGSELAPNALKPLGYAADAAEIYSAYKTDGRLGAAAKIVEVGTVQVGGKAGAAMMPWNPIVGEAAGAAVTQGAIDLGTKYVSPWLATQMFNFDQKHFGGYMFEPGK